MFSLSVTTVPGPAKLWFRAIRLLCKCNRTRIVGLTNKAVQTGRHPAIWKHASRVVIRKLEKLDFTHLELYRTISLLSCMVIVVEKVVAELLSDEAERTALLSDG